MAAANDNSQKNGRRRFARDLACPDCGQKGTATWEENATRPLNPARSVVNLSEGFHTETGRTSSGETLIVCNVCDTILDG